MASAGGSAVNDIEGRSSIQVILAPNSYTFNLQDVPSSASVKSIKELISQQCPGKPQSSGQRLIHQGKLLDDNESLPPRPDGQPRVVHLAVHPSAWTGTPPPSPQRQSVNLTRSSSFAARPSLPATPTPNPTETPLPLTVQFSTLPTEYITHVHANALRVLSGQNPVTWSGRSDQAHARRITRTVIKYAGLGWPAVFEEEPRKDWDQTSNRGVQYTSIVVENLPYLALLTPEAEPTGSQKLALRQLTYTFPLLPLMKHLPRPAPAASSRPPTARGGRGTPGVAAEPAPDALQRFGINLQLGAGPARAGRVINARMFPERPPPPGFPPIAPHDPNLADEDQHNRVLFDDEDHHDYFPPVPEFRFNLRLNLRLPEGRVLMHLAWTIGRAIAIYWFFEPARGSIYIFAMVAWVLWEVYVVIRGMGNAAEDQAPQIGAGGPRQGAGAEGAGQNAVGRDNQPGNRGGPGVPPGPAPAMAPGLRLQNVGQMAADLLGADGRAAGIVDRLARMNLTAERAALELATLPPISQLSTASVQEGPQARPAESTPPPPSTEEQIQREMDESRANIDPSLVQRIATFGILFAMSLVPELWERRRALLLQREQWVRENFAVPAEPLTPASDEHAADEPPNPAQERQRTHELRRNALTGWRRHYIDRVLNFEAGEAAEL